MGSGACPPPTASIAYLLEYGWKPILPHQWLFVDNLGAISQRAHDNNEVTRFFKRTVVDALWRRASRHDACAHNG